jgi:protein phosphatase
MYAPLDVVEADVLSSEEKAFQGSLMSRVDESDDELETREWEVPSLTSDDGSEEPTRGGGAAVHRIRLDEDIEAIEDEPTGRYIPLRIRAGGRTDEGTKRSNNEDALLMLEKSSLYVVADGMGGHEGGEVASRLAVEAVAATFSDKGETPSLDSTIPPHAVELMQSFAAANEAVRAAAAKTPWLSEMGTTVVAALFCPCSGRVYVAHVGDSRCYRMRDGQLQQITTDHTLGELGATGRMAHRLSRAVGSHGIVEVDLEVLELREGDVFLLCSDGINKALTDPLILEILQREVDPEDAAWALIARANALKARDNITALVVRVDEPPSGAAAAGDAGSSTH